MIQIS